MQMIGPIIRAGLFERQTEDLEIVLGRPATSLQDAVAAVLRTAPDDTDRRAVAAGAGVS